MPTVTCSFCGENQATLMITDLTDGDTQSPCGPCLPSFALGLAAALTDGMPLDQCQAYGTMFDAIAEHDARLTTPAAPVGTSGKAKRSKPASVAADAATVPLYCAMCGSTHWTSSDGLNGTCNDCGYKGALTTAPTPPSHDKGTCIPVTILGDEAHNQCGECKFRWCELSDDCPKVIFDRHPRTPAK